MGVVSTNALELGIDIGTLQAAVLTGYPGTIASTWQQLGRAGRSHEPSLAVLVATSSPLNQFMIQNPDYFLDRGVEYARINPNNLLILISHLKCAAFELPFTEGERFGEIDPAELLDYLTEEMVLRKVEGRWYWMSEHYPAAHVSLRSASTENFAVIDTTDGKTQVIGEVERFSAPMLIHEGAIYIHESRTYQIDHLDWEAKGLRPGSGDGTTTPMPTWMWIQGAGRLRQEELPQVRRSWAKCWLPPRPMYKKIKFYTHENIGWGQISAGAGDAHHRLLVQPAPGLCRRAGSGALQSALGCSQPPGEHRFPGADVRAQRLGGCRPAQIALHPGAHGVHL